jgi:hypothetical protein
MGKSMRIMNLELGMPTTETALKKLSAEMSKAKREGILVLKVIHGYGSSGVGGKLKVEVRRYMVFRKNEKVISAFVPGDRWSIFDSDARYILDHCPEMRKDTDLENCNDGITVVLL